MQRTFILLLGLTLPLVALTQLQHPDEFLPHRVGEQFTPHHMLVDYFEHVAQNSPRVKLVEYGRTNEGRPLLLAFVSSAENINQLDAIRTNNLRRTSLASGTVDPALDRAIVWLSFSVHGNEAAGSEASPSVLYELANPNNSRTGAWLENTVVVIDPSVNPDGYDRYTHWYRGVANRRANPDGRTLEHQEPWPNGRVNHYLFDLNRDWAWQTQVESQQRAVQYQQWMPHVHADLHEQHYNDPYYFAPAARPYHRYITSWQGDFQTEIGRNHAKYFDRNGWLYFTKEVFDLLYPSYGDTYPTFNGAIGMTYEQGGSGRGGRAIITATGDTLTLADRIDHHRTTALSTVEVSSQRASALITNFRDYFQRTQASPPGEYRTYVIKHTNAPGRLRTLTQLLDRNGIRYGQANSRSNVRGYSYTTHSETSVSVEPQDLVISAYQPRAVLTQVLFDPTVEVEDSLTYDITAWSLPYAYGLDAYALTTRIDPGNGYTLATAKTPLAATDDAYAYAIPWQSTDAVRLLAALLDAGVRVRYASTDFRSNGVDFPAGSLLVTRADNRKLSEWTATVQRLANASTTAVYALSGGWSDEGPDLGSDRMRLVLAPRIALLGGPDTYANEFGQVWYYLEQELNYPVDIYPAKEVGSTNWSDYDVLIMPEGRYSLSDADAEHLNSWVSNGGRLIVVGDATGSLIGKRSFGLKAKEQSGAPTSVGAANQLQAYGDQQRQYISQSIPGAIVENKMDTTHPLAYGLGPNYLSLKTSNLSYAYLDNGWNVGTVGQRPFLTGFVGNAAYNRIQESLTYGVQPLGGGQVIYLIDNPLFRGFWENGKLLFANALFLVQ